MASIQWTDDLSVGIDLIDTQHQALIDRLNDVSAAAETGQGEMEIVRTLGFLSDYATFHFSAEEKHMAETDYPGLAQQKGSHQEFMATLRNLEEDFEEEGATRPLANAVNNFLANWLTSHIRGVDSQFGRFLKDRGIVIEA